MVLVVIVIVVVTLVVVVVEFECMSLEKDDPTATDQIHPTA